LKPAVFNWLPVVALDGDQITLLEGGIATIEATVPQGGRRLKATTDVYAAKDCFARDAKGELRVTGIAMKGEEMFNVVFPKEWEAGLAQQPSALVDPGAGPCFRRRSDPPRLTHPTAPSLAPSHRPNPPRLLPQCLNRRAGGELACCAAPRSLRPHILAII
jgi:hypothetical protein